MLTKAGEEQQEAFRREWEARNGHLAGRATEPVPEPARGRETPKQAKVMEAAKVLSSHGSFSLTQLVVRCWLDDRKAFGLDGWEDYPCSRKVATALYGSRGLIARGCLRKLADGRLEVVRD